MEAAPGHKFSLTPYFSIIIGVTLSVLLCLLLSFVKRGMRNRRLRCALRVCCLDAAQQQPPLRHFRLAVPASGLFGVCTCQQLATQRQPCG